MLLSLFLKNAIGFDVGILSLSPGAYRCLGHRCRGSSSISHYGYVPANTMQRFHPSANILI